MAKINTNYLSQSGLKPQSSGGSQIRAPRVQYLGNASQAASSARVNAPQIRSTIQATPQPIQQNLVDKRDVTNFANVVQEKTLRIQDEQNTLLAKERLMTAKEELRNLGYSADGGYFTTQGRDSVVGREPTEQRVNEIVREALEGTSPAIQEKVLAPLLAEREAFSNQVARYSISQKRVWEDQVKEANLAQFDRELGTMVGDQDLSYKATLHKAHDVYPDFADGVPNEYHKALRAEFIENSAIKQVSMLIDTPGGIEAATERMDFYKERVSLSASKKMLGVLEKGIDGHNKVYKEQEARWKKQKIEFQQGNQDALISAQLSGKDPISEARLAEGIRKGMWTSSFAVKYQKAYLEGDTSEADKSKVLGYEDLILQYPNGIPAAGSVVNVVEMAMQDPDISLVEARRLRALQTKVVNTDYQESYKQGKSEIDIITAPERWQKDFFSKSVEENRYYANEELRTGLAAGKPLSDIMSGIRERYSDIKLPVPVTGQRPMNMDQVKSAAFKIKEMVERGDLDQESANIQYRILKRYQEDLNNG